MTRHIEGEPAVTALAASLARVTALVPYLTARINPTDGALVPCQTFIDDPSWLGQTIRSSGAGLGSDDPVVSASAFVQGYSYRVLTLTIACLTATGIVPDASAPRMAIGLTGHWPSLVAFSSPRLMVIDEPDLALLPPGSDTITDALRFVVDAAIESHLRPLIASVRTGIAVPLGERLLWGNVAASAATAFRTMAGCLGSFLEPLGETFFTLAPPEMQGLGSFSVVEHAGRRGWFWERTNCCLLDRLPGGVRCADCSLTPPDQRRHAYRASLEESLEES